MGAEGDEIGAGDDEQQPQCVCLREGPRQPGVLGLPAQLTLLRHRPLLQEQQQAGHVVPVA